VSLIHNTFVGTSAASKAAVHMQGTTGHFNFYANIFSHFTLGLRQAASPPTTTVSTDHNVFFSVTLPYIGPPGAFNVGAADITGTVLYRNAAADDYHLLPGSVGIDYAPSYGLETDFVGQNRPFGDNFDVGFDEVYAVALGISKTDGQSTVLPGAPLTYTIVVANSGPADAVDVLVTDSLPASLTGATWTCAASAGSNCPAAGTGSINASVTVADGGSVTFTVHATVADNASGKIVNTVNLTVPDNLVNSNAANASASDSTTILGLYLPIVIR
jgi:uncharacterized repeat protein (TIGR01451 family)